ncbi:hypothetical protein [Gordonia phthalatica]|uniref:hypothetical protein n=1 Tax=Gordonia phthalatica TaxID=1136941 RepID=UPI000AD80873|nr:hypothetical protein [Gordonia phthalatica]
MASQHDTVRVSENDLLSTSEIISVSDGSVTYIPVSPDQGKIQPLTQLINDRLLGSTFPNLQAKGRGPIRALTWGVSTIAAASITAAFTTNFIHSDWFPASVISFIAFAALALVSMSTTHVSRITGRRASWMMLRPPLIVALNASATVLVGLVGSAEIKGVDTSALRTIIFANAIIVFILLLAACATVHKTVRGRREKAKADLLILFVAVAPVSSWAILESASDKEVNENGSLPTLAVVALLWLALQSMFVASASGRDLAGAQFVVLDDKPQRGNNAVQESNSVPMNKEITVGTPSRLGTVAVGVITGVVVGLALGHVKHAK